MTFPAWMKVTTEPLVVVVNVDELYQTLIDKVSDSLNDIGLVSSADPLYESLQTFNQVDCITDLDQYWIEVLHEMAKLEVKRQLLWGGLSAWPDRQTFNGDKEKWKVTNFKKGRAASLATRGGEARKHYKRLYGFLPG